MKAAAIILVAAASVVALTGRASGEQPEGGEAHPVDSAAVIRGLDKITARVRTMQVAVDHPVQFGTLQIVVRTCRKRPPEEMPESAAFLEIDEVKAGEQRRRVFGGWMFASSPGLSALEHPIYDVWVVDCVDMDASSAATTGGGNSE